MFELDETKSIDGPASDVWAVLIDFANVPLWEDGVLEVRQTSGGRAALGTTFVARRVFGGRESNVDCRIIEWQDGRSVTMEIAGGPVRRASARYVIEPTGDRTCRVMYSIQGELQPRLTWLSPLIPFMGRRLVRSNLVRLERLVQSGASAGSSERDHTALETGAQDATDPGSP
ncbi:MAG TPA: SRPBCC family protein [Candidatus Limnocylindrales bacterium]|nr:SRPBCC family protein [Candidatus Limnocylindrales bacterium]